jgi:tetrathionate reductase subunit B
MQKRYGLLVDQERCIGCEACTVACRLENQGRTPHIRIETVNSEIKDRPAGIFPDLTLHFLPRLCQHCPNPPCIDACPVEALSKRPDGPIVLTEAECTGCRACLDACPYGAITFNDETQKASKCDLCVHRLDQGLEPFCVICCEGQALHFGDINDPKSELARTIAEPGIFQLNPQAGTRPSVYYRPPKKPRPL